jgi:metallophosphoesterase (TIGR00282 family)
MRFLFCGDIVGRAGRAAITEHLPRLRRELELDFVVANGENAAGGFGITGAIAEDLFGSGVDAITNGNHVWDQREALTLLVREPRLLRPHNYPKGSTPGSGAHVFTTALGQRVLVLNVMGRLFMDPLDDPFACAEEVLAEHELGVTVDAVVVDVHAETTSEKQAFGHFLDGRASLVVGTHTHAPTADIRVLDGGTAFQTDVGMCGDYNSVIGSDREMWVQRFRSKLPMGRIQPSKGPGTLAAVFVETEPATGLARHAGAVVLGAHLQERWPV